MNTENFFCRQIFRDDGTSERRLLKFDSNQKDPDFSDMRFDLHPDEPTHVYEKGVVKKNRSDKIKDMNKDQFMAHLNKMFSKHMSDQMNAERSRQHRLARGRRKEEARLRFADTRKGRKQREAWAERALQDSDVTFKEAEEKYSQIVSTTPEKLFGETQYKAMLEQITNDIWSSAEFQRGTVNYLKAYDKAWMLYMDLAEESAGGARIDDHPLFQSGAFRNRKAPGIYQNGELVRAPSTFIGKRPSSAYGAAKVRERAGVPQDPDRDFLKKEEKTVREGYEKAWRHAFRKKNPGATTGEEDAYVQKLVDQNLRKQGFAQQKVDASRAPAQDPLQLPPEADRKTEKDYVSTHDNIDARDRNAVVGTLSQTLGLNVSSMKEFQKKVRLDEVDLATIGKGIPQVLHFETKAEYKRGAPKGNVQYGLAIVDRSDEDASKPAEVNILNFSSVDRLLDENPWRDGYLYADAITNDAKYVHDTFVLSLKDPKDVYNVGSYQQLVGVCMKRPEGPIPFALDELRTVCLVNENATILGEKLQKIFGDIPNFQKTSNWTNECNDAMKSMVQKTPQIDKPLLKTLLKAHCTVSRGGQTPDDGFEAFWLDLNS